MKGETIAIMSYDPIYRQKVQNRILIMVQYSNNTIGLL